MIHLKRERLKVHKNISFTEKMAEKIQTIADNSECHFADVVRACVENELPRIKERERKRKKTRKN